MKGQVFGDTNPVLCAMKAMQYFRAEVDEASFVAVAEATDYKWKADDSFVINSMTAVSRLCELGKFEIYLDAQGRFAARLRDTQTLTLKVDATILIDAMREAVPVFAEVMEEMERRSRPYPYHEIPELLDSTILADKPEERAAMISIAAIAIRAARGIPKP